MRIRRLLQFAIWFCAIAFWSATAQAAISCSVTPSGFTSVYDPAAALPTDNVSSVTINCLRAVGDPGTTTYSLAANNGVNRTGQTNRARSAAGGLIRYDVYKDAARAVLWGPSSRGADMTGTISFGTGTSASITLPYYSRIGAGQVAAAGSYTDTVTVTLIYSGTRIATNTFPVLILVSPSCQFSTPPGILAFTYTSFQVAAANASTPFAALCTSGLPYTMSLDTTSGTLLGIAYTLALSASASTGTGAAQAFSVNGSIAGGQAGTCATGTCSASNVHTLTITY